MRFFKRITTRVMLSSLVIVGSVQLVWADIDTEQAGMSAIGACFKGAEDQVPSCLEATTHTHDQTLNRVYQDAVRVAGRRDATHPGTTDHLRDAQRAWITFRDKGCLAEGGPPAAHVADNLVHTFCMNRQTLRRTDDLRDFIAVHVPK